MSTQSLEMTRGFDWLSFADVLLGSIIFESTLRGKETAQPETVAFAGED
jgi:hypothetical protein